MPQRRIQVSDALAILASRRDRQVVVSTMTVMQPWWDAAGTERDLPCSGFMGGASAFGLGVQLARPDVPVWILDGDGSLAMQLGSLLTIANARPRRFLHVVFHNGVYDVSGGQPLVGEGRASFEAMARSAGFARAVCFTSAESFDAALDELLAVEGPVLVELITEPLGAGREDAPATMSEVLRGRLRPLKARLRELTTSRRGSATHDRPAPSELAPMWRRVWRSLAEDRPRTAR